jgi:subtilisin family serine protease
MRVFPVVAIAAVVAGLAPAAHGSREPAPATIVQLRPGAVCLTATTLLRTGASRVDGPLRLWRVPATEARSLVSRLRSAGYVSFAQPERRYETAGTEELADPLVASEWWRAAIRVVDLTPPGPGVPVSIVDSGLFFGHEEFASRPNTAALNDQEPVEIGGEHGTMVASLIAAPANGLGLVGIYPDAVLRTYDAARGDGRRLDSSEIAAGILAAARAGRGVINLSVGGTTRDLAIELAVNEAVKLGSLIVAAAGNEGDEGNRLGYPATLPHVLTVGATDMSDGGASFSSRSAWVDLAAPGADMPLASALSGPYTQGSGTSFAAPLVSGAAAWLWTVRPELDASQVFEILRKSARDVDAPGRDDLTGFGILDVPAALAYPAPSPDPAEPNDDVEYVDPDNEYYTGAPPLTTKSRRRATIGGRIVKFEDPRDVHLIWLPRGRTVHVSATADQPITLSLYPLETATVVGQTALRERLVSALLPSASPSLSFATPGAGRPAFVVVGFPRSGARQAEYSLDITAG